MSPRKKEPVNLACPRHGPKHVVIAHALGTALCSVLGCTWATTINHKAVLTPRSKPVVKR